MKKIILLAVAFVSLATITSCSNDDDNNQSASLEGKWEYFKEGVASGGQEVLVDYEHQAGCAKDYSMVTATTIVDHTFFGTSCTEDVTTSNYTRNGNIITVTIGGETFTSEIKTLDGSTLKIYYTDPGFPTISEVTVFKRVN
jgi:hypothetical protein